MSVHHYRLSSAADVHLLCRKAYRTSRLAIHLMYELTAENASYITLLHQVLMRGCVGYPDQESLERRRDELWGSEIYPLFMQDGETLNTAISAAFPDDSFVPDGTPVLDGVLDLIERIVFMPVTHDGAFDPRYVESEKKQLLSLLENENDKLLLARDHMEEEMFRGKRYAINGYGDPTIVKSITPKGLYRFYKEYLNTAKVEIWYCGPKDADEMIGSITAHFDRFTHTAKVPPFPDPTDYEIRPIRYIREVSAIEQGRLCIGVRTGSSILSDGYEYSQLALEILGGPSISKLYENIREKKGLCYACQVSPENFQGFFRIECGISSDRADITTDAIFEEFNALCVGDITESELDAAKQSMISYYRGISDSSGELMGWYATYLAAGRAMTPSDAEKKIAGATLDDVVRAAKKMQIDTVYFLCEGSAHIGTHSDPSTHKWEEKQSEV